MSWVKSFIRNFNSAFIDNRLRQNLRSYVVDTNIILKILNDDLSSGHKVYFDEFFKIARITVYYQVMYEVLNGIKYNIKWKNLEEKCLNLLDRRNVRIVNYCLKDEEFLKILQDLRLENDLDLTLSTFKKNLEETDCLILVLTLYEKNDLITRDKNMREIANLYKISTKLPKLHEIKYKGEWKNLLAEKTEDKRYAVAIE